MFWIFINSYKKCALIHTLLEIFFFEILELFELDLDYKHHMYLVMECIMGNKNTIVEIHCVMHMKWSQNESSTHEGINYLLHVFVAMLKEIQCYFFLRCQILMLFVMASSHHVVKYMLKSPYNIPHLSLQIMSFFGQVK
jgi:hypothetical protein